MAQGDEQADERLVEILEAERRGDTAHLLEALRDPDNRAQAARALGFLGATEAVPKILVLLDARDPKVRWRAVEALGKLRAGDTADRLLKIAEGDEVDWIRSLAIRTVAELSVAGELGERDIVPLLISFLGDSSLRVRTGAALALGVLADPRGLGPLLQARRRERGIKNRYLSKNAYKAGIKGIRRGPNRSDGESREVADGDRGEDYLARVENFVARTIAGILYVALVVWLVVALIVGLSWETLAWGGVSLACLLIWIFWYLRR